MIGAIISMLNGERVLNDAGDLVPAGPEVQRLQKLVRDLRIENKSLADAMFEVREKHSKASFHINDFRKQAEEADIRAQIEVQRLKDELSLLQEKVREGDTTLNRKLRATQQSYVDACRVIAFAIYGRDAEPVYCGETIEASWPSIAAKKITDIRAQNLTLKEALVPFLAWFNQILRTRTDDNDLIATVPVPGSLHQNGVRRRDIRVLREVMESVR